MILMIQIEARWQYHLLFVSDREKQIKTETRLIKIGPSSTHVEKSLALSALRY